jgi:cytochrome c556
MLRKSSVAGLAVALVLSGAVALFAQGKAPISDADYDKLMKQIGPAFQSLQKDNGTMNHMQGVKDAQMLSDAFKQIEAYWEAKKVDDAAGFAKNAVMMADETVKASGTMDMPTLGSAQKSLAADCQSCHNAHREKLPDGTYKIK